MVDSYIYEVSEVRMSEAEYDELIDRAYEKHVEKILFPEEEEKMNNLVEVKVDKNLGTITSNLDAVEASIQSYIADYENYVVSEDSVKDSKALLADIRKQQKALDDERKKIKKEWNAPFDAFEKRAKEVIDLYDKPILLINNQLIKFEEDRKAKRKEDITAIYNELKGELEEYVNLSQIYNSKWENATTSLKSIREDIQLEFDKTDMEISTIKSMESKYEDKGLEEYKHTHSMQAAIKVMNDYRKKEEEILARQEAERKAKEEQERMEVERAEQERILAEQKAEEERKRAEEEAKIAEATKEFEEFVLGEEEENEQPFDTVEESMEEEFAAVENDVVVTIQIKADPFSMASIQRLLDSNNIQYEVVE